MDSNQARQADMEQAAMDQQFDEAIKVALKNEFKSCVIFQIIEGHDLVITETGVFHYSFDYDNGLELYIMDHADEPFKVLDI